MSLDNKKGINLNAGFKLIAESPLDVRTVVDTEAEKQALITAHAAYTGMIVYVKESKRTYQYNSDGTWEFFTKGKEYVHPTGDGNLHVPATGSNSNGRFLVAGNQPGSMAWKEVLPITIGAADRVHTHTKSQITDFPSSIKNPNTLTVSLDGTSQGGYDGSTDKSINITPETINASRNNHTHLYAGSASVGGPANSALKLTNPITLSLSNMVTGSVTLDGSKNVDVPIKLKPIDASLVQSGVFDIARIPKAAMERCVVVKAENDKFKLTTEQIQLGDTVKVTDTGKMYFVVDEANLNNDEGYEVYTAGSATSVPWSGVTGKPADYPPSSHTHTVSQITNFPDAIKNPKQLVISLNSNSSYTYDGSGYRLINITPGSINASPEGHTHSYAGSASVGGPANSVANPITLLLDNVSQGAYNGSSSKEINITPEAINASRNNHKHTIADITNLAAASVAASRQIIMDSNRNAFITFAETNEDAGLSENNSFLGIIGTAATMNSCGYTAAVLNAKRLSVKHASTADSATSATNASGADKVNKGLTIQLGGISQGIWNGSTDKTINITPAAIGASASGHTHNYAGASSSGGAATSANKVNSSLTIQLNGTSQGAWDGSSNKTINITPSSIGAAPSSHSHSYIPLSGSSSITGNLVPQTTDQYTLGSYNNRWDYGHFNKVVAGNVSADSACVHGSLDVDGNITANKVYNAVWNADYAEAFDFEGPLPKVGTIVELCGKRKVRTATSGSRVIGVVSDSYCILAGTAMADIKNGFKVAVGLLGQIEVECKGEIHAGDFIISSFEGVGVSSPDPKRGTIIGRAMESKTCLGIEKVMCLVMPQ